jgi:6-phosphogluconolactonase (cycloisomerase 2 family)
MMAWLTGCGHYTCGTTFGNATCNGSGSGSLSQSGGSGGSISASSSTVLTYYLGGSGVAAAGYSGSTLAALTGFTGPSAGGTADNITLVNKKFVYVPNGDNTVSGFVLTRSSGVLTAISGSPFAMGGTATADGAWSDPKGRFLFVGSEALGAVSAFTINQTTGALTLVTGSPYSAVGFSAADVMAVDASGQFLYAGQLSPSSGVMGFSINQTTGALTPLPGAPFNLGIAQVRTSPVGEFLLGTAEIQDAGGGATDTHVYVYAINSSSGIPTAVSGSPFTTKGAPYDVTISPNGKYAYLPEAASGALTSMEGFSIDQTTGALTALSGSPFTSLPATTLCLFDQSGGVMICTTSAGMSALGANATTGALSHAADFSASTLAIAVTD